MTTVLYASAIEATGVTGTAPDSGTFYEAYTSGSAPSAEFVTDTVAGPVSPPTAATHCTVSAAGSPMTFVSPPLASGFTMSGSVTASVSAKESDAAANASRLYCRAGKLTAAGEFTWAVTITNTGEVATTYTAYNGTVTPSSTVFAAGDRIVFEYYLDDSSAGSIASGYTYSIQTSSSTRLTVYETVSFETDITLYPTTTAASGVTGTPPDSGTFYELGDSAPSAVETVTNTITGPATWPDSTTHCTVSAGGSAMTFVSDPVVAFTLGGDAFSTRVWAGVDAKESSASANVARMTYRVGKLSAAGSFTWPSGLTYQYATECLTSYSQNDHSSTPVAPDDDLAFATGDRIVIEFYTDDATSVTMASGYTYSLRTGSDWFLTIERSSGAIQFSSAEVQTEAGAATVTLTGSGSETVTRSEAGGATLSFAAAGNTIVAPPESGAAGFALAASGTANVLGAGEVDVAGAATLSLTGAWEYMGVEAPRSGSASFALALAGDVSTDLIMSASGSVGLSGESWLTPRAHGADTFVARGLIHTGSRARLTFLGETLPATDTYGWTDPDAEPSDLVGLSIVAEGLAVDVAQVTDLTIELDVEGGPESASMTVACELDRAPTLLDTLVVTYKTQVLFRGRLEGITTDIGTATGYTLSYAGSLVKLRDHKAFRTVFVDSDLQSWRTDQGPRTSPDTFEVMSETSGNG